jgi:hypothetical protein
MKIAIRLIVVKTAIALTTLSTSAQSHKQMRTPQPANFMSASAMFAATTHATGMVRRIDFVPTVSAPGAATPKTHPVHAGIGVLLFRAIPTDWQSLIKNQTAHAVWPQ